MTINDVLSSFYFGFLNADQKIDIEAAITAMYDSATGMGILEAFASSGRTIQFVSSTTNGADFDNNTTFYNRSQIDNTWMINNSGNLFSDLTTRVVVHELLHTILNTPDLPISVINHDANFANFSLPGTDYTGPTVALTNTILGEIGTPADQMRVSYTGTVSTDRLGNFDSEYGRSDNFTNSTPIDTAIVNLDFVTRVDTSENNTGDLILGHSGNEIISTGSGNDFLYGGSGNDTLNGGTGHDFLHGGNGNDTLSGNIRTATQNNWEFTENTLHGGEGDDKYYVTGNSFGNYFSDRIPAGVDTISDSDGNGTVYVQSFERADFEYVALRNLTFKPVESYGSEFPYNVSGWQAAQVSSQVWIFADVIADGRTVVFSGNGYVLFALDTGTGLPFLGQEDTQTAPPGGPGSMLGMRFVNNMNAIAGTLSAETITGTTQDDYITALANNDEVNAGAGNDIVEGGLGDDILFGQDGYDDLQGGEGADTLFGGEGADFLKGGEGNDILHGDGGSDRQYGGAGDDVIYTDHLDEEIDGGIGYDRLVAAGGSLALDINLAASNLEAAEGGNWDDVFDASGVDIGVELFGHGRDDILTGSAHADVLDGGAGNDRLFGLGGDDRLDGSIGADEMDAGAGDDVLYIDADDTLIDGAVTVTVY